MAPKFIEFEFEGVRYRVEEGTQAEYLYKKYARVMASSGPIKKVAGIAFVAVVLFVLYGSGAEGKYVPLFIIFAFLSTPVMLAAGVIWLLHWQNIALAKRDLRRELRRAQGR